MLSGFLTVMLLVCTLLPQVHPAGEGPRGFEIRPAQSVRPAGSDAGERGAMAAIDLDDARTDAAPPRLAGRVARIASREALPRSIDGSPSIAGRPLDRPPRVVTFG